MAPGDASARTTTGTAVSRELVHLAAIVRSADDAIASVDAHGRIVTWNAAAERMLGWTLDEALGMPFTRLIPADALTEHVAQLHDLAHRTDALRFEAVRVTKDGRQLIVAETVSRISDASDRVLGYSRIMRDVTNLEQRRQSQKLEAIGRLAGGVAHDFNNILSVILSLSALLAADLPDDSPLRDDLDEINRAGHRAAKLTEQLLSFSRKQNLQPRVVDLNATLLGMEKMVARILGEDVRLTVFTQATDAKVFVDDGYVEQVILNLAVNARDAMRGGGHLTIETGTKTVPAAGDVGHPDVREGSYVTLTVSDTGEGMDEPTRQRIFEPFFTTKALGHGTGLGLATVFGIVRQSGGYIFVDSAPGMGATFCIFLPVGTHTEHPAERVSGPPAPRSRRCAERILVVEDDQPVRAVVSNILRRAGYDVLDAANAGEALLIAEKLKSPIDLLLTDVVMPLASGIELAERLKRERPALKVLFMSGYTDDVIFERQGASDEIALLSKPVTPDGLLAKVGEVLDYSVAQR